MISADPVVPGGARQRSGVPVRSRWFAVVEAANEMQSGRCLGGVIPSSFRASESNVRQFSWVVWRCVFVWFWGVF